MVQQKAEIVHPPKYLKFKKSGKIKKKNFEM
jgi:hypothetical protein